MIANQQLQFTSGCAPVLGSSGVDFSGMGLMESVEPEWEVEMVYNDGDDPVGYTIVLDKTGTLTYGEPNLTERLPAHGMDDALALQSVASLERYSKHPLAGPILEAAAPERLVLLNTIAVRKRPGEGLEGEVDGRPVRIIGRRQAEAAGHGNVLPPVSAVFECVILVDGRYPATYRFHDAPRADSRSFIRHLGPRHQFERVLLASGHRESEVRYLAEHVGIDAVYAGRTPEEKVAITRQETSRAPTLFMGDGINDAPHWRRPRSD